MLGFQDISKVLQNILMQFGGKLLFVSVNHVDTIMMLKSDWFSARRTDDEQTLRIQRNLRIDSSTVKKSKMHVYA